VAWATISVIHFGNTGHDSFFGQRTAAETDSHERPDQNKTTHQCSNQIRLRAILKILANQLTGARTDHQSDDRNAVQEKGRAQKVAGRYGQLDHIPDLSAERIVGLDQ